mgnify:CR=1 FL=1
MFFSQPCALGTEIRTKGDTWCKIAVDYGGLAQLVDDAGGEVAGDGALAANGGVDAEDGVGHAPVDLGRGGGQFRDGRGSGAANKQVRIGEPFVSRSWSNRGVKRVP